MQWNDLKIWNILYPLIIFHKLGIGWNNCLETIQFNIVQAWNAWATEYFPSFECLHAIELPSQTYNQWNIYSNKQFCRETLLPSDEVFSKPGVHSMQIYLEHRWRKFFFIPTAFLLIAVLLLFKLHFLSYFMSISSPDRTLNVLNLLLSFSWK